MEKNHALNTDYGKISKIREYYSKALFLYCSIYWQWQQL